MLQAVLKGDLEALKKERGAKVLKFQHVGRSTVWGPGSLVRAMTGASHGTLVSWASRIVHQRKNPAVDWMVGRGWFSDFFCANVYIYIYDKSIGMVIAHDETIYSTTNSQW